MSAAAPFDIADVERLAKLAGLTIDPAYVAGVAASLRAMLGHRALLAEGGLHAHIEPAEVFRL